MGTDETDNSRDRFSYGYDAGNIVDGVVREEGGKCIVVDDDGVAFCPDDALKTLVGRKVRITMISFDALENMEHMYAAAQAAMGRTE